MVDFVMQDLVHCLLSKERHEISQKCLKRFIIKTPVVEERFEASLLLTCSALENQVA